LGAAGRFSKVNGSLRQNRTYICHDLGSTAWRNRWRSIERALARAIDEAYDEWVPLAAP
jgi:hypothetical protein